MVQDVVLACLKETSPHRYAMVHDTIRRAMKRVFRLRSFYACRTGYAWICIGSPDVDSYGCVPERSQGHEGELQRLGH